MKTWNSSQSLPLQLRFNRRPAAVNAGYSYSRMTDVTSSSSTVTGAATVRDSVTYQGTTGSATSTFIRSLNFFTKVYRLPSVVISIAIRQNGLQMSMNPSFLQTRYACSQKQSVKYAVAPLFTGAVAMASEQDMLALRPTAPRGAGAPPFLLVPSLPRLLLFFTFPFSRWL